MPEEEDRLQAIADHFHGEWVKHGDARRQFRTLAKEIYYRYRELEPASDLEWDMVNAVFRRIFPDLGPGPYGTIGFRTSPGEWKVLIRDGMRDARKLAAKPRERPKRDGFGWWSIFYIIVPVLWLLAGAAHGGLTPWRGTGLLIFYLPALVWIIVGGLHLLRRARDG